MLVEVVVDSTAMIVYMSISVEKIRLGRSSGALEHRNAAGTTTIVSAVITPSATSPP